LLLLEDPMAGLDAKSRGEVAGTLGRLNDEGDVRIVLVLRGKRGEGMPGWVTDVCEVRGGDVWIGSREEWGARNRSETCARIEEEEKDGLNEETGAGTLVELRDISLTYGEGTRPVRLP